MAVVDAVAKGDNGKVSKDKLAESLEGLIDGDIEGGDTNPWTVKGKITGKKYTITENGNVTEEEVGKTLTEEEKKARQTAINAKIEATVEGYTTESDVATGGWRVYYASTDEVFLISKDVVPYNTAFEGGNKIPLKKKGSEEKYSGSNAISDYGRTYNSMWFSQISDEDISDTHPNFQATAYLCDSDNWTQYKTGPAKYAVGGPTKELFIKSWNEAVKNKLMEEQEVSLADADVTEDGYAYNKPDNLYNDTPITQDKLNGLYNNGKSYWLASPCNEGYEMVCYVATSGCSYYGSFNNWTYYGVRPLVSIPISNVQIEGNTVKIVP